MSDQPSMNTLLPPCPVGIVHVRSGSSNGFQTIWNNHCSLCGCTLPPVIEPMKGVEHA